MAQIKVFSKTILAAALLLGMAFSAPAQSGPAIGDMALGPADAKVTIIEYASMTCPHCANFHNNTFKKLKEKYVDTGKVKFIFREFPLDRVAFMAAVLARCAGAERYFGMIDAMFRSQDKWGRSRDPRAELTKLGRLAGMSDDAVTACFADQKLGDAILASRLEAVKRYDVKSTPTFVVNGEIFAGALGMEEWDKILAKLLN